MRGKQAQKTETTDEKIMLKPVFGIRPGVYLTVLYSILLLIILFLLLFLPGIRNPGSELAVISEPDGAAIRVDGVYMGTVNDKIFVPKGQHILEAVLPGFSPGRETVEIQGRVFASFFFPKKFLINFTLKTADAQAAFAEQAVDFASWTFGGEPTAVWQVPLSLSQGAYRLGPYSNQAVNDLLLAASRYASTRAALRDLVRAKMLLDNKGLSPSPLSFIGSIQDILTFLSENQGTASWLARILPPETSAVIQASNWQKETLSIKKNTPLVSGYMELAGLQFRLFSSGEFIQSEPFPHKVSIDQFYISNEPVTDYIFQSFVNENPSFNNEEEKALYPDMFPGYTCNISWNTARAFCSWLSKRLPPNMSDWEIRLPYEAELEFALPELVKSKNTNILEWCYEPYVHLPNIHASKSTANMVDAGEKTLYGYKESEARASLPAEYSSPLVTFRPVITKKVTGNE
ncbi:MAG: SUMF1/EgtB/PvdO family nonheme iron enzyme [Treponema sp.]|nr:SUMF1/EgtB/PvdO family nonheme iron enzyme [Treponema sp.]